MVAGFMLIFVVRNYSGSTTPGALIIGYDFLLKQFQCNDLAKGLDQPFKPVYI